MAAPILSYENLGLIQGEGWLFRHLDLYVGERDRLALIGRNGAGKTTLLKCLADLIETDEGKRTIVPGTNVVLLEQDPKMEGFATLEEWVLHGRDAPQAHEAAAIADQTQQQQKNDEPKAADVDQREQRGCSFRHVRSGGRRRRGRLKQE